MTKGLKALKDLREKVYCSNNGEFFKRLDIIENELKEYEGAKNHIEALHKERVENALKLKALEIIKRFNFALDLHTALKPFLKQEEYELLKEVLL